MTDADQWVIQDSAKYAGLTVKEKAEKAVKEMGETGQIMKVAWMMEIEKVLHAQIGDCAQLAELHERSEMVKAKNSQRQGEALQEAGHLWEANSARFIAAEIRAFAAPKEEKTEANDVKVRFRPGGFWFP